MLDFHFIAQDHARADLYAAVGAATVGDVETQFFPQDELLDVDMLYSFRRDLQKFCGVGPEPFVALLIFRLLFLILVSLLPTLFQVTDYYSRLEITEEGRFNLQTVAAPAGDGVDGAEAGVAAPASAASAVQVSAPSAMLSRLPIDLVVNSTLFDNGRVDFRDRFIRPNYSAQLSELNGTVGRLDSRTRDMATLQFSGRVAGTGLLEISGAVNPTVIPPALDIKAKAHDIELPGLTPYSSKYAMLHPIAPERWVL